MRFELENGQSIEVYRDEDAENPWDEYGVCLWDIVSNRRNVADYINHGCNAEWVLEKFFDNRAKQGASEFETRDYLMTAVYMYEHSVTTISLSPFSCPWDSGIGYVAYIDKYEYRKLNGGRWNRKKAMRSLEYSIKQMDAWLQGDCYGYELYDVNGDWIDGCCGFYGWDELICYLRDELDKNIAEKVETSCRYGF